MNKEDRMEKTGSYFLVRVEYGADHYCRFGDTKVYVEIDNVVTKTDHLLHGRLAVVKTVDRDAFHGDTHTYEVLDVQWVALQRFVEDLYRKALYPPVSEWQVRVTCHYGTHSESKGEPLCLAVSRTWKFRVDTVFPSLQSMTHNEERNGGCGWY